MGMNDSDDDISEDPTNPNVATFPNPATLAAHTPIPDLGLIAPLMDDPNVTEIMINDLRNIAIERKGQLVVTPIRYKNIAELNQLIQKLLDGSGRKLTAQNPLTTLTLSDGTRVHIAIPPVTELGPCITLRRFPKRYTLAQLSKTGMFDAKIEKFLRACIVGRQSMVISGGTGTGKTTLLNALIAEIPPHERVITIEDSAEIPLMLPNQVKLMTQLGTQENESITPRKLLANALRMRPDRIIIGECRGEETLDMIQAMNTGHPGSMTTVHANSARDTLFRMETLALSAGNDLSLEAVRRQIAGAVQMIIQIQRLPSGKRKITSIHEITGLEQDAVLLQEIFRFVLDPKDPDKKSGVFIFEVTSRIAENLKKQGIAFQ